VTPALSLALQLLIAVESNGNPRAFNAKEQAIGILQIRPIMVEDVNRILGEKKYEHSDAWEPKASVEMATIYLEHYGSRLGGEPSIRDYGLLWCAGPDGPKQATNATMEEYVCKLQGKAQEYMRYVKLDPSQWLARN
jgi:hypothetical protein